MVQFQQGKSCISIRPSDKLKTAKALKQYLCKEFEITDDSPFSFLDAASGREISDDNVLRLVKEDQDKTIFVMTDDTVIEQQQDLTPMPRMQVSGESSDHTLESALGELLDNSLEACTKSSSKKKHRIQVRFFGSETSRSIAIEDTGIGMNLEGLSIWGKLHHDPPPPRATNTVKLHANGFISRYGVGAKKACFRLGDEVFVETKPANSQLVYELTMNKEMFSGEHATWKAASVKTQRAAADQVAKSFTRVEIRRVREEFAPVFVDLGALMRLRCILAHMYYFYTHSERSIDFVVADQMLADVRCTETLYQEVQQQCKIEPLMLTLPLQFDAKTRINLYARYCYFPLRGGVETFPAPAEEENRDLAQMSDAEIGALYQRGVEFWWQGRLISPNEQELPKLFLLKDDALPPKMPREVLHRLKLSVFLSDHFKVTETKTNIDRYSHPLKDLFGKNKKTAARLLVDHKEWGKLGEQLIAWLQRVHAEDDPDLVAVGSSSRDATGLVQVYTRAKYKTETFGLKQAIEFTKSTDPKHPDAKTTCHGVVVQIISIQDEPIVLKIQEFTYEAIGAPFLIKAPQLKKLLTAAEFDTKLKGFQRKRPAKLEVKGGKEGGDELPRSVPAGSFGPASKLKWVFVRVLSHDNTVFKQLPGDLTMRVTYEKPRVADPWAGDGFADAPPFEYEDVVIQAGIPVRKENFFQLQYNNLRPCKAGTYHLSFHLKCDKQADVSYVHVLEVTPAEPHAALLVMQPGPYPCGSTLNANVYLRDKFQNRIPFSSKPKIDLHVEDIELAGSYTVSEPRAREGGCVRIGHIVVGGKLQEAKRGGFQPHTMTAIVHIGDQSLNSQPVELELLPGDAQEVSVDVENFPKQIEHRAELPEMRVCVVDKYGNALLKSQLGSAIRVLGSVREKKLAGKSASTVQWAQPKDILFTADHNYATVRGLFAVVSDGRLSQPQPGSLQFSCDGIQSRLLQFQIVPGSEPREIIVTCADAARVGRVIPASGREPAKQQFFCVADDQIELTLTLQDESGQLVTLNRKTEIRYQRVAADSIMLRPTDTPIMRLKLEYQHEQEDEYKFWLADYEELATRIVISFSPGRPASLAIREAPATWKVDEKQQFCVQMTDSMGLKIRDLSLLNSLQLSWSFSSTEIKFVSEPQKRVHADGYLVFDGLLIEARFSGRLDTEVIVQDATGELERIVHKLTVVPGDIVSLNLSCKDCVVFNGERLPVFTAMVCDVFGNLNTNSATTNVVLRSDCLSRPVSLSLRNGIAVFENILIESSRTGRFDATVHFGDISASLIIDVQPGRGPKELLIDGLSDIVTAGVDLLFAVRVMAEDTSFLSLRVLTGRVGRDITQSQSLHISVSDEDDTRAMVNLNGLTSVGTYMMQFVLGEKELPQRLFTVAAAAAQRLMFEPCPINKSVTANSTAIAPLLRVRVVDQFANIVPLNEVVTLQVRPSYTDVECPQLLNNQFSITNGVGAMANVCTDGHTGASGAFELECSLMSMPHVKPAKVAFSYTNAASLLAGKRDEQERIESERHQLARVEQIRARCTELLMQISEKRQQLDSADKRKRSLVDQTRNLPMMKQHYQALRDRLQQMRTQRLRGLLTPSQAIIG
eukprot:TRINITY_DN9416_c0_g1_i1.p1 TRINITY_DN9416_c0_g1~~TRINITY_DN9416_c0_g1_i1.p1  ORF type:complete len:1608 (-),score=372.47 TRINITY_DN9416_c0_g1_i1:1082-5905(-)